MADAAAQRQRLARLETWWGQEPLAFETRGASNGRRRFEFSSRGDRVEGWLREDERDAGDPLIVVVPGSERGAADATAAVCAEHWCAQGVAVSGIDLPLHGARRSAKLSDALVEAASDLDGLAEDDDRRRLVDEFLAQCRWDLRRALDGLVALRGVVGGPIACVGLGLGALACAHTLADGRVGAAVLIDVPPGGPPGVDASVALRGFGRPLLLVDAAETKIIAADAERVALPDTADALAATVWPFLGRVLKT